MDRYASLPYDSRPIPESDPAHLAVLARLHGVEAAAPETARILEIGCASGGNLMPLAARWPGSTCLGIDLSTAQVEAGRRLVAAAGLDNVALRAADLAQIDPGEIGRFDYVIAHGVYSWVPEPVRAALLDLCRMCLEPNGIAYVSYNTLPGWRLRGMLRDFLGFATHAADADPLAQAAAAEAALQRLLAALQGLDDLGARYLRAEIPALLEAGGGYLLHEYLAPVNDACLFRDFVSAAATHGLRHLADAQPYTEFAASLGAAADAALATVPDPVERGQWFDFVFSRKLRRSLLCHADAQLSDDLDLACFAEFAFSADLAPPPKLDLRRPRAAPFTLADGSRIEVHHPLTRAVLLVLGRAYPAALSLADAWDAAVGPLHAAGARLADDAAHHLVAELFSLFAHGAVRAHLQPRSAPAPPGAMPTAMPLARAQAAVTTHIATLDHGALELDLFAQALVAKLDGTRSLEVIATELGGSLQAGELAWPDELRAASRSDPARVQVAVRAACEGRIRLLGRHGLLTGGSPDTARGLSGG
jgi:2-polyprenyl-3-methyl-5-hydroxy-6-metoxy-1,4-benzoquinol methylase/methyltransferase-like protein